MKTIAKVFLAVLCVVLVGCASVQPVNSTEESVSLSHEGYKLEKVVILSRHNIRSPLVEKGSVLASMTPHEWFEWSSGTSELSLKGGVLETIMGQYFRKWLDSEGLIKENTRIADNVRIYSNSKQRTIATARFFSAGLFPNANVKVEYHLATDSMDPVFNPQLVFESEAYFSAVRAQVSDLFSEAIESLEDNYELMVYVTDTDHEFRTDDTELVLKKGAEPGMTGSLKLACQLSDAIVLQYFEESDEVKAAFGKKLSMEEWEALSEIKDVYGDVLFTAPLVAPVVAHPLLVELKSEMEANDRVFSFLCGHDSNVGSVLSALQVKDYSVEGSIEKKTPIGCKLVFSQWSSEDGSLYWSVDLVYQTTEQLREDTILDLKNNPGIFHLEFEDMQTNEDGLYADRALMDRFSSAISGFDKIESSYK